MNSDTISPPEADQVLMMGLSSIPKLFISVAGDQTIKVVCRNHTKCSS